MFDKNTKIVYNIYIRLREKINSSTYINYMMMT
nr:MAG TPA: hypothetical protein [Caudoviricetes sp.]